MDHGRRTNQWASVNLEMGFLFVGAIKVINAHGNFLRCHCNLLPHRRNNSVLLSNSNASTCKSQGYHRRPVSCRRQQQASDVNPVCSCITVIGANPPPLPPQPNLHPPSSGVLGLASVGNDDMKHASHYAD